MRRYRCLCSQKSTGLGSRMARDQQPLGVLGRGRGDDLDPRRVHEPRLGVLRVERPAGEAAAAGQPHGDRHREPLAVVHLARHVDELVEAAGDEVRELHLAHRPHADDGGAHRGADDADSASGVSMTRSGPNSSMNPSVTLNAPPNDADVLAHAEHALVARASPRAARRRSPADRSSSASALAPRPTRAPCPVAEHVGLALAEHARGGGRRVGHRHGQRLLARRPRSSARDLLAHGRPTSTPRPSSARSWRSIGSLRRHSSSAPWRRTSCRRGRRGRACASSRPRSASGPRRRARARAPRAWPRTPPRRRCRRPTSPGSRSRGALARGRPRTARSSGVEYANWLFSRTKITGSFCTPAQFIASWKSPRDVEPSPNQVSAQRGSPRSLNAIAMPVATSIMSGSIETIPTQPSRQSPKCTLPSRPPVTPPARPMYWPRMRAGVTPRTRCAPRSRCRMHSRSCGPIANAAPTRDRLLAEAVVERARDLALPVERHRALLDAAHQEHVAQERDAVVGRQVLGCARRRRAGGLRRHLSSSPSEPEAGSPSGPSSV